MFSSFVTNVITVVNQLKCQQNSESDDLCFTDVSLLDMFLFRLCGHVSDLWTCF